MSTEQHRAAGLLEPKLRAGGSPEFGSLAVSRVCGLVQCWEAGGQISAPIQSQRTRSQAPATLHRPRASSGSLVAAVEMVTVAEAATHLWCLRQVQLPLPAGVPAVGPVLGSCQGHADGQQEDKQEQEGPRACHGAVCGVGVAGTVHSAMGRGSDGL